MKILGLTTALLFLMTACGGKGDDTAVPHTSEGPALIMFYTDN